MQPVQTNQGPLATKRAADNRKKRPAAPALCKPRLAPGKAARDNKHITGLVARRNSSHHSSMDRSYLKNHLLIAMPGMEDDNFARSVTFLFEHDEDHAIGIVVNRLSNMLLDDLLDGLSITTDLSHIASHPVFLGGPVQSDRGFVLHEGEETYDSTLKVGEHLKLTTSKDVLQALAEGKGPNRVLVALGYAGWGEGQLEREIAENAWIAVPVSSEILFHTPTDERWQRAAALIGIDLRTLTPTAGHA